MSDRYTHPYCLTCQVWVSDFHERWLPSHEVVMKEVIEHDIRNEEILNEKLEGILK